MSAVSAFLLVGLCLVVVFGPRRWAGLAILAGTFFLTQGHAVDVAGVNLYPLRLIEAAAFSRVLARGELAWSRLNRIDTTLLLLYNYSAIVWMLRSTDVVAQQFAAGLEPTLCYLAFRGLGSSIDDLKWYLVAFVAILVPYTGLVVVERVIGHSAFTLVGAPYGLAFREGVPRCSATFRHSILLGSVAASFLPLYIGLWLGGAARWVAVAGAVLCTALIVLSNSGGPLTSAGAAVLGWAVWPLRDRMRLVRWAILATLVVVTAAMKAPIWYLPFKVSGFVGGGGYHRGVLMERAWHDLGSWWLAGMDIKKTAHWLPYVQDVVGGADITNQFLAWGIRGGIPAVVLAVLVLVFAFKGLGGALRQSRGAGTRADAHGFLIWGLGVALLVHIVSWFGVSYFDQSYVVWLWNAAAVAGCVPVLATDVVARRSRQNRVRGARRQRSSRVTVESVREPAS